MPPMMTPDKIVPRGPFDGRDAKALDEYIASARSFVINEDLRRGDFDPAGMVERRPIIEDMRRAFNHAGELGAPIAAFRGIDATPRDLTGQDGSWSDLIGQEFADPGFTSTTGRKGYARDFGAGGLDGVLFDLTIDPKVHGVYGANPAEDELLLEDGVRYVIRSVRDNEEGGYEIAADVLPPRSN
jgi:hypothetical protein